MQLYEKVISKGGKTSYRPYTPPNNSMLEIPQEQVVTLLTTLTVSMLMSVSGQMPDHARAAREIKGVEQAVVKLAKLNAEPLDDHLVNIGVACWNSAIRTMQEQLGGGAA